MQAAIEPAPLPTAAAPHQDEDYPPDTGEALERLEYYLVFHLGEETYGVEISPVREIITLPPLTPLPLSPDFVLGVMNLAGAVVPVFDLRLKLGLPPGEAMGEPIVVVIRLKDKLQGVVVDAVEDVLGLSGADIQEPPEMAGPMRGDCLTGLVHRDGLMIILVDLALLLTQGPVVHAA
ncbi:MAG: chemotaxis protein CheW [Desulfarculaceae bacterium]|nr:chemotaxis protein CheW [Desulfarculaceae bacterium]MCF8047255.1 chemotaxis protein CheW [Desulfarculaceae bacterium]MCF8065766.1 chemotaxis protein CheW [Desulfarculaceae bacterium]MCF8097800.1 chemotaxis protein CheW [Desulfarculaceae bacterium]MCF8122343.1 chemotaxis protein CheW [Desulfarculaceae bacterium]